MTLCSFLPGGKKNRGKEEKAGEYGSPPRGKFSLKPGVSVVAGFCFVC